LLPFELDLADFYFRAFFNDKGDANGCGRNFPDFRFLMVENWRPCSESQTFDGHFRFFLILVGSY